MLFVAPPNVDRLGAKTYAALCSRTASVLSLRCCPGRNGAPHFNDHIDEAGEIVFRHACQLGFEGIVSKRLGSPYISGPSRHWIKSKNPAAAAVKREAEEDWDRKKWR